MPDEFNPIPGSFMERVDKAGGIEAYEEAKKFMEEVAKVKPEQWSKLNETFKTIKGFIDVETDVFRTAKDEIVASITLKTEELLSPIRNEIDSQINKILEPLLPFINDTVNNIIVPAIQFIAGIVQTIVDLIGEDKTPWEAAWDSPAVQWVLAHPGKTYVDYLLYLAAGAKEEVPSGYTKIMDIEEGI